MRKVITLNKSKQETGSDVDSQDSQNEHMNTSHTSGTKPAGQAVIQVKQNKLNRQHQLYSEQEHATVSLNNWSGNTHTVQMAEDDMNDPDLAASFAGASSGYMLQPG